MNLPVCTLIDRLLDYTEQKELSDPRDRIFLTNAVLRVLHMDAYEASDAPSGGELSLQTVLDGLCDHAVANGVIGDSITERDLLDTELMGLFVPYPSKVQDDFAKNYAVSPETATDAFYRLSSDCNYIRTERVQKDLRWTYDGAYGTLDITINLSKPEKDPKAIASALKSKSVSYPKCQLCAENVGYCGRADHPARENLRTVPVTLAGEAWQMQYSPYVYYNEHCIVFNERHTPMKITEKTFARLLDFVEAFPHYFIGSNADLPIVGGSILTHDHFQGGHYIFAMEKASALERYVLPSAYGVEAEWVNWPLTVLRLTGAKEDVYALACRVLSVWRGYTDEEAMILAQTDGIPHNTITPIARRKGESFQLDLVLRNNITTEEHPFGLYHPHIEKHHIKKENIGLIEVMGLAVLPSRLKAELSELKERFVASLPLDTEKTEKHRAWFEGICANRTVTAENIDTVLNEEVGKVFESVLEDAGVFRPNEHGACGMHRFLAALDREYRIL